MPSVSSEPRHGGVRRPGRVGQAAALVAVTVVGLTVAFATVALSRPVAIHQTSDLVTIAGEYPTDRPVRCVSLSAAGGDWTVDSEVCGAPTASYRVVDEVVDPGQCPADVDTLYSWSAGPVAGALCLDYDWAPDQCLLIEADAAGKSACTTPGAVRPTHVIVGASDASYCPAGGVAHPVRRFTVCVEPGSTVGRS